jgi:hypothetical protein
MLLFFWFQLKSLSYLVALFTWLHASLRQPYVSQLELERDLIDLF